MIGKILMAYDGSDNGRRALDVAAELAHKLDAELMIAHVLMHGRPARELARMAEIEHMVKVAEGAGTTGFVPSGASPYELLAAGASERNSLRLTTAIGEQVTAYAKDRSKELGVRKVETIMLDGDYADEIMDAADDFSADMIVIGSRGLGTVRGTILGSVSQKVVHHAAQIVATVK